jgi:mannitol-specific phosphotransferase system IIBC component
MVAKLLAKQLKSHDVSVSHTPVNQLAASGADLVLCHRGLATRAKQAVPDIVVVAFDMFLGDPRIASVVKAIETGGVLSDD